MKIRIVLGVVVLVFLSACCTKPEVTFIKKLNQLDTLKQKAQTIHPVWKNYYPVTIAHKDDYYIFQYRDSVGWELVKKVHQPGQVPKHIQAAFPMSFWENRMSCVIDPSVLQSVDNELVIFHEFVHCYQWDTCEVPIKNSLKIYQTAMQKQDWMWELNYPFPYEKPEFQKLYKEMIDATLLDNKELAQNYRTKIKMLLTNEQWEYLCWQEFKEGSARWLENKLRLAYGYNKKESKMNGDWDRTIFYEGGSRIIEMFVTKKPELITDFVNLWEEMK